MKLFATPLHFNPEEALIPLHVILEKEAFNVYRRGYDDYEPALSIIRQGTFFTVKFWKIGKRQGENTFRPSYVILAFDTTIWPNIWVPGVFERIDNNLAIYDKADGSVCLSVTLTEEITEAMKEFMA